MVTRALIRNDNFMTRPTAARARAATSCHGCVTSPPANGDSSNPGLGNKEME